MRIRRRHELQNIGLLGDINELEISGHVEQQPVLREDYDGEHVCESVLTHTAISCGLSERQYYNVEAYGQLGVDYAADWQPEQAIVIHGRLEYQVVDTLAGPHHSTSIIAHDIDTALGEHPHQPASDHRQQ